jgi:hypothetical protein
MILNDKLSKYQNYLVDSLRARSQGESEIEDELISLLDDLWYQLSVEEKAIMNSYSSSISSNNLLVDGSVVSIPEKVGVWSASTSLSRYFSFTSTSSSRSASGPSSTLFFNTDREIPDQSGFHFSHVA